jgi:amino acid adenylation domain-containing protein
MNPTLDSDADNLVSTGSGNSSTLCDLAAGSPAEQLIADVRPQMIPPSERQPLLLESNGSGSAVTADRCIHTMFEMRVQKTPDAVALVFGPQRLSYRELNSRANQLAHYLRRRGVGPDDLVAIYMDRSLEMIVAILGILKAGGAYLPIDLAYPADRLAFMLQDSDAKILITQEGLCAQLPPHAAEMICLDRDWQRIGAESAVNPPCLAAPHNLAYVMYTSGSTGRPKGVQITHANVMRLFSMTEAWFHFGPNDVWTLFHSYAFDVSVWELWGGLLYGGRLVIVPYQIARSPGVFYELLCREHVTILNQTPSAFTPLIAAEQQVGPNDQLALRLVVLCGEALNVQSLKPWFEVHGDRQPQLVNMYGPTETTVFVTSYPLSRADLERPGCGLIGRSFADTRVYILDPRGNLAPVGVPGELCLGGAGLARGYLNRPELNAEKFVPDPFLDQPAARLYKTGDLMRWLPDGNLEFLGRLDQQVKIRGFRIELGEIESCLRRHPAIQDVAVVAREDSSGGKRLVAYLVARDEKTPATAELRSHLKLDLPEYMLPAAFVMLKTLPLTPNGKLDRRALPAPESRPLDATYVPLRNEVERRLGEIWEEVLGVGRVGAQDNFFELGGHSLLATQVLSRIHRSFAVQLSVAEVFARPTIAELAEQVSQVLAAGHRRPLPPLSATSREGPLPLSFAQQRLWFVDQLFPHRSQYNIPAVYRLRGTLDGVALERAWREIVRRHEALRTRFETVAGRPYQVIERAGDEPLMECEDLSGLAESERVAEVTRRAQQEAQRPFDLATGPFLRVRLWRLADQDYVLMLTLHHIIVDGWSIDVLFRELSVLYQAYRRGQPSPLPELPLQYADYAIWQRSERQIPVLEEQLRYWQERLAGVPMLALPTDQPRPAFFSGRGGGYDFVLSAELTASLKQLSRQQEASLFMVLLAAWQVLLSRYSGQQDVVVGVPTAGRTDVSIEGLIGNFINTLPLRSDLSGDPRFDELLRQVRQRALEAFAHQEAPFEQLVDTLKVERDPGREPLVQVMFAWQNTPCEELQLAELAVETWSLERTTARLDLALEMREAEGCLEAHLDYCADLFGRSTIERLARHWETLLTGIVSDSACRVSQLPLLPPWEREQLLVEWNGSSSAVSADQCIHQMFEMQVQKTPDAVALVFGPQRLSYRELNSRANQLARYLRRRGVGPDDLVAIYMDRSLEMIVAILGILKAGGAYLPIDLAYPPDRLAFMLQDSDAKILITQEGLCAQLPPHAAEMICLDRDWQRIGAENAVNLPCVTAPHNLAHVIYTSGSTGRPKGVPIAHANVVRLFSATEAWFHFGPDDVWSLFHSYAFDVSVCELWGGLLYGGRVVIVPYQTSRSPEAFYELLCREQVSILNQTPSAFSSLIAAEQQAGPNGQLALRLVMLGGEPLNPQSLKPWFEVHGDRQPQLFDVYGPTETTVLVTCYPLSRADLERPMCIPIGRPLADIRVYVRDPYGNLAPVGVPGELCIGGPGVARGYLNRPDLTVEKFVPDPYVDRPGARLYKTGDLVRWLPEGNLEFLGRLDQQVKIRGFRIELGEIESCLRRHPAIRDAAVVAREEPPGDKRLVAYVVAKDGQTPAATEMRSHLKQELPEFMVPAAFVTLKTLPLTPNGKVDRRALPAPDAGRPELEHAYAAPRKRVEVVLARIWAAILGLERVGIHDNFFELGGNSLLAAHMVDRVQKTLHKPVPVATIFRAPTIAELARQVASDDDDAFDLLEPIRPAGNEAVVLAFGGGLMEHLPDIVPFGHPLYWCSPEHMDGKRTRFAEIEDLAAHYCRQIAAATLAGPYVLCGFSFGGLVAFETARQLYQREGASTLLFLVEPSLPNFYGKRFRSTIIHHLRQLPSLPRGQRTAYVSAKTKACGQLVSRWTRQFYCGTRLAFGLPIPVSMRWPCVEDRYRRAAEGYVPRPFPGKVFLVKRNEYQADYVEQWARLAEGGFSLFEMNLPDHVKFVTDEQAIAQWADPLRRLLRSLAESPAAGG